MGIVRQRHVKVAWESPWGWLGSWTILPMTEAEGCSLGLVREFYETPVEMAGPERGRMAADGALARGTLRTPLSRFSAGTLLDMIFKRVSGDLEGYRVAQVGPVETISCTGMKAGKGRIRSLEVGGQRSGTATARQSSGTATARQSSEGGGQRSGTEEGRRRKAEGSGGEVVVEMELVGLGQVLGSGGSETGYAAEGGYALNFATFLVDGEAPGTVEGFEITVDNRLARGPFGPDGRALWLVAGRRSVRAEVILGYESGAHSAALVNGTRGVFRVILGRPLGLPGASATIELPAAVVMGAPIEAGPGEPARQKVMLAADVDANGVDVTWSVA
jgi:hypothetical protein